MLASVTLEYSHSGSRRERMDSLQRAGFTAINIGTPDCMQLLSKGLQETNRFRADLHEHGLIVDWLHAPYSATVLHDHAHDFYSLSMGAIKSAIVLAAELEAHSLIVHPFGLSFPDDVSSEEHLRQLTESFDVLVEIGRLLGVKIAIENINEPHSKAIIPHLLDNIEELYFCFDSGHASLYKTSEYYLPNYIDRISALHIHDNNGERDDHLLPGDGNIELSSLIEQLRDHGYTGYLGLECLQKTGGYSGGHVDLALDIKSRIERMTTAPAT